MSHSDRFAGAGVAQTLTQRLDVVGNVDVFIGTCAGNPCQSSWLESDTAIRRSGSDASVLTGFISRIDGNR